MLQVANLSLVFAIFAIAATAAPAAKVVTIHIIDLEY
jgi:hypothetical protein